MIYREFHCYDGSVTEIVAFDEADEHRKMMLLDRSAGCPDEKNKWIDIYKEDMKLKNRLKRSMKAVWERICPR